MSLLNRILPSMALYLGQVTRPISEAPIGGLYQIFTRNIIRIHFPRPSERKRILRHGWKKRMSTPEGRRVLMNRILKGRHVYSH